MPLNISPTRCASWRWVRRRASPARAPSDPTGAQRRLDRGDRLGRARRAGQPAAASITTSSGIVFGGEWEDPDLRDSSEIDAYFIEHFGKKTIQTDLAVTEKYRYVPEFDTGGTFGVNMRELNERILSFNYTSIYASTGSRLRQHENFILNHYLAQFNEETIKPKIPALRRTLPGGVQKAQRALQEGLRALSRPGSAVGVFDQRAAELLNDHSTRWALTPFNPAVPWPGSWNWWRKG